MGVKEFKRGVFRVRVGRVREEEGEKSEGELERVKKEKGKWLSE